MNIIGLSYSHSQTGSYALILSEDNGPRRIPISIGSMEAQSIAIHLEGLRPPRPLTHDLFTSFAAIFDIKIKEVIINKFENNIFYSELICIKSSGEEVKIDSRTSDAVAIALRFNSPIYMSSEILNRAGVSMSDVRDEKNIQAEKSIKKNIPVIENSSEQKVINVDDANPYSKQSVKQLQEAMAKAIAEEDYEKASILRDEINKR